MRLLERVGRKLMRRVQGLVPSSSRGVTILAYHLVEGRTGVPVDIGLDVFRHNLEVLKDRANVLSLAEALSPDLPDTGHPNVVITFDDAFANFADIAWPLLQEFEFPVTLYVPVAFIEGTGKCPIGGLDLRPMSWTTLRDLSSNQALTIGSHSYAHVDLRTLNAAELKNDLRVSRQILEDRLGRAVPHLCYPQAKWNRRVEACVKYRYESAAIAGGRKSTPVLNPYQLSRYPIRSNASMAFEEMLDSTVVLEEWAASCFRLIVG